MPTDCQYVNQQVVRYIDIMDIKLPIINNVEVIALTAITVVMGRVYVDIGRWWLKDENGEPLSVYAVHQKIAGTTNEVSRHTLTRARDGLLEKADISNLKALARLCSEWSGKKVTIDDLIVEENA